MLKTWFRRWIGLDDTQVPVSRSEWLTYKTEISALLEAILDQAEVVEHKRRQTTAAAARAKKGDAVHGERANVQYVDQLPPEEQRAAVRRLAGLRAG